MVTLQHHVSSILDKSARAAAEEIIKLFDSSFEAFSEELHKRQEEIDTLRRKLEVAETELNHEDRSGPAYLCAQCGVSLNTMIPLEENHKAPDSDSNLPQDLEADLNDQTMDHAPIEEIEAEDCIEFELPPEEDDSYSQLIQKDESTRHTETTHQEGPARKEESAPHEMTQKRGRGRPRKQLVAPDCKVSKRGRGRPRKAEVSVSLKSSKIFSAQEQPKKAQIKKESANKLQATQLSHNQTSLNHKVSTAESQSTSTIGLQTNKRGRPRKILDPLLIPFGEAKSILNGQENHVHGPEPLKNKLQDEFLSKTEEHLPLKTSQKDQADKRLQQKPRSWIVCPKCPRQFPSKTKLQAHAKFHLKKGEIKCKVCGMTFIGQSQMNNHERVHTGEKPYSCSFCPRRFPNLSQYKKHMLNHAAPDYACEVCGLRSSQVCKDTFRKAHLRSKAPCSNCASIYT
ncbi:zinc finger protein 84-like [Colossoma macropomum]|uniref:zinc finger protein 84-like n=1 Tax=Colossoma macropomum TaxID=42526 RepID=UPI001864C4A7|nr:zinc finger protein 84-like [Colossoma macropomum]